MLLRTSSLSTCAKSTRPRIHTHTQQYIHTHTHFPPRSAGAPPRVCARTRRYRVNPTIQFRARAPFAHSLSEFRATDSTCSVCVSAKQAETHTTQRISHNIHTYPNPPHQTTYTAPSKRRTLTLDGTRTHFASSSRAFVKNSRLSGDVAAVQPPAPACCLLRGSFSCAHGVLAFCCISTISSCKSVSSAYDIDTGGECECLCVCICAFVGFVRILFDKDTEFELVFESLPRLPHTHTHALTPTRTHPHTRRLSTKGGQHTVRG